MPYVYLLIAIIVAIVMLLIWSSGNKSDQQLRNRQIRAWKKTSQISALLTLYCAMAVKHGPDSDEAEAFKFNLDDPNMLGDDEEGKEAFLIASSIFAQALKKHRRMT